MKKAAVDIVRGLTGSEDGLQSLCYHAKILLPSLIRLLRENKVDFAPFLFPLKKNIIV